MGTTPVVDKPLRQPAAIRLARSVVEQMGGRYSTAAGIDVDASDAEVERWFLAATLFGTRISATIAQKAFSVLDSAGLVRVAQARDIPWDDLVALLDTGGYTRYDFRTADRLHALGDAVRERYRGNIAALGRRFRHYPELRDALDELPGWGPTTIEVFLRELRGVWPGASPPLDDRALQAARHLGLVRGEDASEAVRPILRLAHAAELDARDLECALVRLALAHDRAIEACPGKSACLVLQPGAPSRRIR